MPLYFGSGQGGGAIRNPLVMATLVPGADYQSGSTEGVRVNGFPTQSFTILIEGQDASNPLTLQDADISQPAFEAVQEFTLQSSNFAAEFGTVTGGLFNFTTKSGTNQYHGSMFDYFTNSVLNAGVPFTVNTTKTGLARPATVHNNDYGASVGGPVRIPKLYNGRNKTFFFFNYEAYDSQATVAPTLVTVPTLAMRAGNFSGIPDGRNLGKDVRGQCDSGKHNLRPLVRVYGEREHTHQCVSRQHYSGKPDERVFTESSGIVAAARNFRESPQLHGGLPKPKDAVDPQFQDRPEYRRQDEAIVLLRHTRIRTS